MKLLETIKIKKDTKMSRTTLRDRKLNILGFVDDNNEKLTLRGKNQELLGFYDSKSDITRDKNQKLVGKGNQLGTLLPSKR